MSSRTSSRHAADAGAFFDARAERYDRAYDEPGGYALRSRMAAVLRLLGDHPREVLDAGMGAARLLVELSQRGWSVSGVDASRRMVDLARSRLPAASSRLLHGKIEALPFAGASFDAVVATGVLEYADVDDALAEINRVLRPGGLAVISYPNPGNFYWLWRSHVWHPIVGLARSVARKPPLVFPPPSAPALPQQFRRLLAGSALEPREAVFTSFLVVPEPLDALLPSATEWLSERIERRKRRFGSRLAGQVVYSAWKRPNGQQFMNPW